MTLTGARPTCRRDAATPLRRTMDELTWAARALGADTVRRGARLQSLWGGYGELYRVHTSDPARPTAILKSVTPPAGVSGASVSHARKARSYDVEAAFYRGFAARCAEACRVAEPIAVDARPDRWLFLLEDLDADGFTGRRRHLGAGELEPVIAWLAAFHARFVGTSPGDLWPDGTYWHLATRAEELAALSDDALRRAAPAIDERLRACAFRTLVHGDAKVANFCFRADSPLALRAEARGFSDQASDFRGERRGGEVAAVDFQYVGGGVGVQDLAYFLISTSWTGAEALEPRHLDTYFRHLRCELARAGARVDAEALEVEWRALYPFACADFYRFYAGWAPVAWRLDRVGHRVIREVLERLGYGR